MNQIVLAQHLHIELPWHLSGEGYILNYWLNPQVIEQFMPFGLKKSKFGRLVQIMLVRYHSSPVGPYDELLFLDHASNGLNMHSHIPKIYVSSQASVDEGRYHWGIPKELAQFEWSFSPTQLSCQISVNNEILNIQLNLSQKTLPVQISSRIFPAHFFKIEQQDQQYSYQFAPHFKGHLAYIPHAEWQNTQNIFPDLSQAIFMKGFYSTDFQLTFPEALKIALSSSESSLNEQRSY